MKHSNTLLGGLLASVLAVGAAAAAESDDAAAKPDADEGVICRKVEVTGSHRRVRVCTTRAQREAARDSARELLQDTNRERAGLGREAGGAN